MKINENRLRALVNEVLDDLEGIPSAQAQVGYCDADDVEEIGDPACDDCDCHDCNCGDGVEIISIDVDEEPFDVCDAREELMSMFDDDHLHNDRFSEKASLFNRLMNSSIEDTNRWSGFDKEREELMEAKSKKIKNVFKTKNVDNLYEKPKTIKPKRSKK